MQYTFAIDEGLVHLVHKKLGVLELFHGIATSAIQRYCSTPSHSTKKKIDLAGQGVIGKVHLDSD
jgi:hypothetical protein